MSVLVLGGTGRVGKQVISQLLERGVSVKAVVRSKSSFSPALSTNNKLTIIEGSVLDVPEQQWRELLQDCTHAICALGHVLNFKGVFGPPYRLVTDAAKAICKSAATLERDFPLKFIMLNTLGVDSPLGNDIGRGIGERMTLGFIGSVLPPFKDSLDCAKYFHRDVGYDNKKVEWVLVRPSNFVESELCEYEVLETRKHSLFAKIQTTIPNIAHFMCDLATKEDIWQKWKYQFPVILDIKKKKNAQRLPKLPHNSHPNVSYTEKPQSNLKPNLLSPIAKQKPVSIQKLEQAKIEPTVFDEVIPSAIIHEVQHDISANSENGPDEYSVPSFLMPCQSCGRTFMPEALAYQNMFKSGQQEAQAIRY
ncbi:hypothetical protein O9G_000126 [Rozella allomycis CSF55]|uniref:NAD(P)-binding domain-containing protein n=1 Tax=Rozella allomycis (strain CSF55) TaxID=988480 RepID=A0A075ANW2_ROZAC|nr:hypothetical protein O9G_000126 [Rozella allomycis CSF55]|eukprot:EPZ31647.1 hypothetical protein O9G_000126 [Rozella allomycis CSF55]